MKVVILCGGRGTRFKEETDFRPKPMIEIGSKPILWHIMKSYAAYGFNDFILCLGYKAEVIKEFFYNYEIFSNDFTIELGKKKITVYDRHGEKGWKITLVDTGLNTMTGARIKRIEKYIKDEEFMLTYGDGLTDMNLKNLLRFHRAHGKIGTASAVFPQSRYGELTIQDDKVLSFTEKPLHKKTLISGGYFIFQKKFFKYLTEDNGCTLEKEPLEKLVHEGQLKAYTHDGFWQCMDTYRDYTYLQELWEKGNAPWVKK